MGARALGLRGVLLCCLCACSSQTVEQAAVSAAAATSAAAAVGPQAPAAAGVVAVQPVAPAAPASAPSGVAGSSVPARAGAPATAPGVSSGAAGAPAAVGGNAATPPPGAAAGSFAAGSGSAAGSGGSGAAPQAELSAGCSSGTLKAGDSTRQLQSNDRMRRYLLHIPAKYDGKSPVPLVFDFHGYSSSPQGQMGASGFRELGDQEGFIVLYPEGVGASWHVNGCCGQAMELKLDEIAFVRAIMDDVGKQACIDLKRVYASGISQGGGMAHHVACLAADIFAGVAPVSSDLRTEACTPARPITEISFRGLADRLDAYEGGHVGPPGMDGYTAIGAKPTLERWKTINMCTGTPEKMGELCETYSTCAGGSAVSLCSLPGGDHVLYRNMQGLNLPKVAWELFMKHPR